MNFEHILFEIRDHVGYITLNNPANRNPVPNPAKAELMQVFDRCDFDDDIRAVVLRGAGGNFSAGGDLHAMRTRLERGERGTRLNCRLGSEMNLRLRNVKKPTIACVEGAVAGAGMCLALSCDFQIVAEDAKMTFAFVNIGYVPDSGATYLVSRAIGYVKATELFMSGKRFTGRQAAEWGLVTEAVPQDQIDARLETYIMVLLAASVFLVILISNFISNSTAVMVVLPSTLAIVSMLGYNAVSYTLAISYGASLVICTPLASAQIAMSLAAGYRFSDYFKYNIFLQILVYLLILLLLPVFFPLR